MCGKRICLIGVLAALLGLGVAQGQEPYTNPMPGPATPAYQSPFQSDPGIAPNTGLPPSPPPPPTIPQSIAPIREVDGSIGPSSWILYPRSPGIAGPMGANGPLGWEVYLWNGSSIPISGNYMGRVMDPGWDIEGGGRTLFYNPAMNEAWVVELGIGNIHNEAGNRLMPVTLHNLKNALVPAEPISAINVTMTGLNQTYGSVGVGKEWYIWGSAEADPEALGWRVGVTAGGRYGTLKADFDEIPHLTDTTAGAFLAAHTDIEVPFGPGFWVFGLRAEFAYTWADVLQQQNNSDIMAVNLMGSIGYRW